MKIRNYILLVSAFGIIWFGQNNVYAVQINQNLVRAVATENLAKTKMLLDGGANANAQSLSSGFSVLMIASQKGNLQMMNLLIDHGAKVDLKMRRSNSKSTLNALCIAIINNQFKAVKLLLKRGANINATIIGNKGREKGFNALMFAIFGNRTKIVHYLIAKGINLHAKTSMGTTALHTAVLKNNLGIAKILLEKGMRTDVKNIDGFTPLTLAEELQYSKMVKLIKKYKK